MALRSGLGIVIYTAYTTSRPLIVGEYTRQLDSLSFTTLSPGGFGQMSARLNLNGLDRWHPEFGLFSRIAVVESSGAPVWLGEMVDPVYGMDQNGAYVNVAGLGAGNALRDDPLTLAYVSQRPQQIVIDQLTRRAAYMPIDQDTTGIFPDNPSTTISPVYQERTMEDVINDVIQLTGDYAWGVWGHPAHRDVAGFPTAQVLIHQRDVSTLSYLASISQGDVVDFRSTPTAARAYNVTQVDYLDPTTGVAGSQTYTDPRLNGDGSQGAAPFRRRKYTRNLRGIQTATSADAYNIANTYGPQMQDPSAKTVFTLGAIRDPNGIEMPLWRAQADSNMLVPELYSAAQTLSALHQPGNTIYVTPPTPAQVGVSQFYIVQTTYREDKKRYTLEAQCDNYADDGAILVARLQEQADEKTRQGQQTTGIVQAAGASMRGYYGWDFSNATSGQGTGASVQFPAAAINVPTSLTFTSIAATNVGTISAGDFTTVGAHVFAAASANGAGAARGTYQTNGNCLLYVDGGGRRFAKHCDVCNRETRDLALDETSGHIFIARTLGETPGRLGLSARCPHCGQVEAFNTGLTAVDERHALPWRAEQARLIRALMAAHGLALL